MSTVSIRDVAKAAGVSTATVSYVLNESRPVGEDTRKRVLEAARRLGYQPNVTARGLQARRTFLVGYCWPATPPRVGSPILDRFIHSMGLAAYRAGYHLLAFPSPSSADEVNVYRELVRSNRVDGIVLSATNLDDPRVEYLNSTSMPFAAFGRSTEGADYPWVDVDGRAGIRLAISHLVEQGHRRIGMLAWPPGSRSGEDRFAGYLEGLAHFGLPQRSEWIRYVKHDADDAYRGTRALLDLPPDERPTGIVCVSDLVAIGAMNALRDAGIRIGEEVGVVGFDDIPLAEHLFSPLTSIHQPVDEIGQLVIDQLMTLIREEPLAPEKAHILLEPKLVVRASSVRLPGTAHSS